MMVFKGLLALLVLSTVVFAGIAGACYNILPC